MARPERFDEYVDRCLYDPSDGFYARHGSAGRARGDFLTSPEVGPLFGEVIGRYLDAVWADLGESTTFTVVEAGAGRGVLARAVLGADLRCSSALEYVTVERSDRLREAQRELLGTAVTAVADLDAVHGGQAIDGVILANELLDNLAFRLVVRSEEGWDEVFVDDGAPVLGPLSEPIEMPSGATLDTVPIGTRLPACAAARQWVERAVARLGTGRLLLLDYGVEHTVELVGRDWLRTYRGHDRGGDPFEAPGRTDITCDVPFDQLPPAHEIVTQAAFLARWGLEDLVDEGRRIWAERAHVGDLDAIRARSRVHEAEALTDPAGLGGFLVAEWRAAVGTSPSPA